MENVPETRGFVREVKFGKSFDPEIISPVMNRLVLRVGAAAISDGREQALVQKLVLFLKGQVVKLERLVHDILQEALWNPVIYDLKETRV